MWSVYAIANAKSIAFGKDPCKMNYSEALIWEHPFQCFSGYTLEIFP